jgi:hypothetical protein
MIFVGVTIVFTLHAQWWGVVSNGFFNCHFFLPLPRHLVYPNGNAFISCECAPMKGKVYYSIALNGHMPPTIRTSNKRDIMFISTTFHQIYENNNIHN